MFLCRCGRSQRRFDDTVWPHRWVVYGENYDGDPDVGGVKVYDYACSNEIRESLKNKIGTNLEGIGTFVHEFGHVLGFSDHYSTNDNNLALDRATTTSWLRHRISTMDVRLTDIQPMSVCIWDGLSQRRYFQAAMATR